MNLLITSVGRRSYMVEYFQEVLSDQGKVHVANNAMTYAMKIADVSVITPDIYNDEYIDFVLKYCQDNNIDALISLFDIDLPVLAKNKDKFDAINVKLIISDPVITGICNDKWQTFEFLRKNGFNVPETFKNLECARTAILKNKISFPLIVKPRWGMGSIGIYEAENEDELDLFYNKTKSAILKSYLKYESIEQIDESIIIQQKILGEEHGLDILNDLEGNFLACVPKRKLAMRAGETDVAKIVNDESFISLGKKMSSMTHHIGNMDVDFFSTPDGEYYILEMNCRFGGQYPFSHLGGVNFPSVIVDLVKGIEIDPDELSFSEVTGFKDIVIRSV